MKEKNLKILVYLAGLIGLCGFIAVRYPAFFNVLIQGEVIPDYFENTRYGELYNFNNIAHFKEDLPPSSIKYRYKPYHPTLEDADIITFGDSFFDFTRMKTFPEKLGDTLQKKVYFARYDYPLNYFAEKGYTNTQRKVLLYETSERYIATRFANPHTVTYAPDQRGKMRKMIADVRDKTFLTDGEVRYSLLLARSYLTKNAHDWIATLKFDLFGYISSITPVYAFHNDEPWLFYYEEVNQDSTSFYYPHTDEDIDRYCDNIADLRLKLKSGYNLDMIFMPVPSKYTIYHKIVNDDPYNDLLPRLYKGLSERGVPYIDLYEDFLQAEEVLYYGTDTHWNPKGLDMALRKTVSRVREMGDDQIAFDSIHSSINQN